MYLEKPTILVSLQPSFPILIVIAFLFHVPLLFSYFSVCLLLCVICFCPFECFSFILLNFYGQFVLFSSQASMIFIRKKFLVGGGGGVWSKSHFYEKNLFV